MSGVLTSVAKLDAHHRVVSGVIVAAIVGVLLHAHPFAIASLAAYNSFAFVSVVLVWITVLFTPREQIRIVAQAQDVGRTVIFTFVVVSACAALFAVAFLIRNGKPEIQRHFTLHVLLALLTVIFSWLLMHTVFSLRYAHTFYGDSSQSVKEHAGGLEFPGKHLPKYVDFAYFSFVIGMTCQVSDVQITSREIRQLALVHGILAFGFNTAILALTINIISGLL